MIQYINLICIAGFTQSADLMSTQTEPLMMNRNRVFLASPLRNNNNTDSNPGVIGISPLKRDQGMFSPFKESSLSPFKLINESPSKGSFDEWDKDFITSFEDNLFGDVAGDTNIVDEWLRSPQGKALLERKNSPLRHSAAVRRLIISPQMKHRKQQFQPLHDHNSELLSSPVYIKEEQEDIVTLKEEITCHDHMYGQSIAFVNTNTLSAVDPNKMSATPIKPRFTNVENAPIRKLSMRIPGVVGSVPTVIIQKENVRSADNCWPSREKLKFARMQFRDILNKAVENELAILREQRRKKASIIKRQSVIELRKSSRNSQSADQTSRVTVPVATKSSHKHGGKVPKGIKSKGKAGRKAGRKDKYPQIKMALSKPVHVNEEDSPLIHRELFPPPGFTDPGWYPSEEEDDVDIDTWSGPPPLFKKSSNSFHGDDNESSDDEWTPSGYQYETLSGRKVKKRKLY